MNEVPVGNCLKDFMFGVVISAKKSVLNDLEYIETRCCDRDTNYEFNDNPHLNGIQCDRCEN